MSDPDLHAPDNSAPDRRAVGLFDSGVGGLTVLHECLVNLDAPCDVYVAAQALQ